MSEQPFDNPDDDFIPTEEPKSPYDPDGPQDEVPDGHA